MYEAINWPADMAPSKCPIHFTNELEVAASPETIWSLLTHPENWPSFYPNVTEVPVLLGGGTAFELGARFDASLIGLDVAATVTEFEPTKRLAWSGGPKTHPDSRAHHAWIITPTAGGTHLWTEETMQGPLWLELAKPAPDVFWQTHETLLKDLAAVAVKREASSL